jgi:hypothetical protein
LYGLEYERRKLRIKASPVVVERRSLEHKKSARLLQLALDEELVVERDPLRAG